MSEEKTQEAFIGRWSRLKQQDAQDEKKPAPAAEARPEPVPAAPLPAVEDLKPDSDFKPFMDPKVDAGTRRSALKKLFTNAHFNAIDAFEPYSIDLTGEDPIPEEMLKTLNHARRLLFDEKQQVAEPQVPEEAHKVEVVEETQASPQPQAEQTDPDVAGKQDS